MKFILIGIIFFIFGVFVSSFLFIKIINQINKNKKKIDTYYHLFDQWLSKYERGQGVDAYFRNNGYENIAIYGMKELGEHLLNELLDSEINVSYVIDRNLSIIPPNIMGYHPNDELPKVDVIVVTASYYFFEIKEQLKCNNCDIVSIDDVICFRY